MFIDLSLPNQSALLENDLDMNDHNQLVMRQGHYGTHLDSYLRTDIPLEYVRSRGLKLDISAISSQRPVENGDIALDLVQEGDFVIFHTGALLRHTYASKSYFAELSELSWNLIDTLRSRKIRFIGIDIHGIRMGKEHGEADRRCEEAGVYVIENMNNTEQLPAGKPFTVYTAWYDLGVSGLPCRAVAELT